MRRLCLLALLAGFGVDSLQATEPNADTKRWWAHVQALANDGMRGRDTGSEEHRRAAAYVAQQFQRNGIRPAGENGNYLQNVTLHAIRLLTDRSTIELTRGGRIQRLRFLEHLTIGAAMGLPETVQGDLVFAGSDNARELDTRGKVLVRLNPDRLVPGPQLPAAPAGIAAVIGIDGTGGPEPARWPVQYSVSMALADTPLRASTGAPQFNLNPASADLLLAGSGHTYKELRDAFAAGQPVPSFAIGSSLRVAMQFETRSLESQNVIGVLPGTDAALAPQMVAVSAHLDGYGIGSSWKADAIYNGAFDDAAYVATLIDMAESLRQSGVHLRRSLLFAVVTGEEKGLLGSRYFMQHPTVDLKQVVADVNLDQLRPLYPLRTLIAEAVDDSSLGDTARQVASTMDIRIQADAEPLRNLLRRSDNWNFIQAGVPAISFIFGYEKGSSDEAAYRRWYADRYHTPLDDLSQPWDPTAAAKFNQFFRKLVEALANAGERPQWKPGSALSPKP